VPAVKAVITLTDDDGTVVGRFEGPTMVGALMVMDAEMGPHYLTGGAGEPYRAVFTARGDASYLFELDENGEDC